MNAWKRLASLVFLFSLAGSALSADKLTITEFMALNDGVLLRDEDGESSDWIEIHNGGTNT